MRKDFRTSFFLGVVLLLLPGCPVTAQTNIAPNGQGYYWYGMSSATATTHQTATTIINNGNLNDTLNCDVTGETSTNRYEGAGVIFSSAQSNITSVAFINGPLDSYGNGNFEANLSLQTYNGSSWSAVSGWTVSPAYPYTSAAAGQTYTFSGPALNNVRGVRVVGEVRLSTVDNSWSWTVNEVMIYASGASANFTLSASPSSQSVTAGSNTSYTASVSPQNGFTGTVSLSASGAPSGVTASFSPASISGGSGSSTLNVTTSSSTAAGTYTLTITGTSGSLTHTAAVSLTVTAPISCTPYTGSSGASFTWSGVTWNIDPDGSGIGSGQVTSLGRNISVDSSCYLHETITTAGTGTEMFSNNAMGFGTYQWVMQGANYYSMDPAIVLGVFPYGPANNPPAGADGQNEIDLEFSKWGSTLANAPNIDFTVYPPPPGDSGGGNPSTDQSYYLVAPSSSTTTLRFVWHSTSVSWYVMTGTVPISSSPTNVIQSYVYNGDNTTIPQGSFVLGMNLWGFNKVPKTGLTVIYQSFGYQSSPN